MKTSTLVDSNILIDVWGPPGQASEWSGIALTLCHGEGTLVINAVIWSELAPLVSDESSLEIASTRLGVAREPLPWGAAFLAGIAHAQYRRSGGTRERTLPDFLIGAHASVGGHRLLTRDAARYRSYFPSVEIICPETHP
ncbi:type II toxin-antitoxin system VapC family toxin [Mesorhizobium sp. CN2-181]|uniref:type II toxin-antitoxin system VapC family toxin n=1 Tax=Mesorhizobium yinganensis TaxID=3157707 RepID=UPI0032B8420B